MKTYKEIQLETLEQLRERTIAAATENDVFLSSLKRERLKSGKTDDMNLVSEIRKREANVLQFEGDISLIEEKLNNLENRKEAK